MRHAAEQRSAELTSHIETWRKRAEDRAVRIQRLVEERPGPIMGWLRPKPRRSASIPASVEQTSLHRLSSPTSLPGLRTVRVAALVSTPGVSAALDVMDRRDIVDQGSLDDADLVVIESAALQGIDETAGLRALISQESGPPVVLWNPSTQTQTVDWTDDAWSCVSLPPSFDPLVHSPASRRQTEQPDVVAGPDRVRFPDGVLIEHAAAGGVVVPREGGDLDELARSAASVVARRWAYRFHSPWVRARQLTDAAGIGTYDPWPSAAGVLVSKRPEFVLSALEGMSRQTYRRLQIIVGLHGGGDREAVAKHAEQLGITDRTQIIEIPKSVTLGEALNRCIDRTDADIIAKIDDDDAYGPAYIEDAVHTLIYSGAGIVGKAAQFFYFAQRDVTVLRRSGTEEKLIDGTPTGASLVFRRAVWEVTRFPHRPRQVDVHFVRGARVAGVDVYAANKWEFRMFRGHGGHTWTSDDETLLVGSTPMFDGDEPGRLYAAGWPIDGI